MNKYRLISVWNEAYVPKHYRQDGNRQERVECCGLTLEEASKKFHELFSTSIKEGWSVDRYEVDDGLYRNFELIGKDYKIAHITVEDVKSVVESTETLKTESEEPVAIEVTPEKENEPIVLDVVPTETVTIEPESSADKFYKEIVGVEIKAKEAKAANEPFCRCLYEIENNLKVSNYCEMSCKDQSKILQKRKQEKRLRESESSTGNKSCE